MSTNGPSKDVPLPNLGVGDIDLMSTDDENEVGLPYAEEGQTRVAQDLEKVFDVPVKVSAVLGRARMDVGDLLRLGPGSILELDRRVGEAIDIFVNDRLVARGEVVIVEDKLGVTMTEILKAEK